jgi:hypothetical protein
LADGADEESFGLIDMRSTGDVSMCRSGSTVPAVSIVM